MSGQQAYRVMVIEDQVSEETVRSAFAADAELSTLDEPILVPLNHLARNADDAIEQLDAMTELPDAILLDDYLPEGGETSGKAIAIMAWLCGHCIASEVPVAQRPRVVLWTRIDPELAYTFCVLGGLQAVDKRSISGEQVPVTAVWTALAGERWQPEPYPAGLDTERHRAPLPWMEAGWQKKAISDELKSQGVTDDTMETTVKRIREMPHTPKGGGGFPSTATMAVAAARRNGWVWVPLQWHDRIPKGAPLPLVIDPDAHRDPLPPVGPLPFRVQATLPTRS